MSHFEDPSLESNYQFPPWSTTISRPLSSLPSKDAVNDMFKLGIDTRNQLERPDSSPGKRIIRHHVRVPTASRILSPPNLNQPSSTPDITFVSDRLSTTLTNSRVYRSIPVRIKSTSLTIPISTNKEQIVFQNFPKQTHEKRKIAHERKRRKQQAQTLAEKYAETDTWFQLRRSLAELKRLAATQEILLDPTTSVFNCDGYSLTTLKQIMTEQQQQQEEKKTTMFKSESGASSSFGSVPSSRDLSRASVTISQASLSRPRLTKRTTETYPRSCFQPFIVASKPIHSPLLTENNNLPSKVRIKPPATAPSRVRPNPITPLSEERRAQLLISDLSNDDCLPESPSSSPPIIKIDQESPLPLKVISSSPARVRAPSSVQMTSTIKLKPPPPRCRSATDTKSSFSIPKNYPRFILIADQEHRIESWYHQYPFILSDDLLASFESKQKLTISAYFIDDLQSSNHNITAKTFLQGKPFHINNDWKKYDLIFVSNNIYDNIILYLQSIINLIKSSGKIIQIYQINHEEDLKKQVKQICKQLQQQQNV